MELAGTALTKINGGADCPCGACRPRGWMEVKSRNWLCELGLTPKTG
jgi:hypothetical protein